MHFVLSYVQEFTLGGESPSDVEARRQAAESRRQRLLEKMLDEESHLKEQRWPYTSPRSKVLYQLELDESNVSQRVQDSGCKEL